MDRKWTQIRKQVPRKKGVRLEGMILLPSKLWYCGGGDGGGEGYSTSIWKEYARGMGRGGRRGAQNPASAVLLLRKREPGHLVKERERKHWLLMTGQRFKISFVLCKTAIVLWNTACQDGATWCNLTELLLQA